jgi:hypothetical protein
MTLRYGILRVSINVAEKEILTYLLRKDFDQAFIECPTIEDLPRALDKAHRIRRLLDENGVNRYEPVIVHLPENAPCEALNPALEVCSQTGFAVVLSSYEKYAAPTTDEDVINAPCEKCGENVKTLRIGYSAPLHIQVQCTKCGAVFDRSGVGGIKTISEEESAEKRPRMFTDSERPHLQAIAWRTLYRHLREAVNELISVEDEAQNCEDCAPGAFCQRHDAAFWGAVKDLRRTL